MRKLTMLLVLAGCPSKPTPATTTPASPTEKSGDAVAGDDSRMSPDDYPARKLQVLRTPSELSWVDAPQAKGVATAGAWGDPSKEGGWFIKLAQGSATQQTYEVDARGIVVTGTIEPSTPPSPNVRIAALSTGSSWTQPAGVPRTLKCATGPCVVFVETTGAKEGGTASEKRAYELSWAPVDPNKPNGSQVAQVWGDMKTGPSGMLTKIPAGNPEFWHIHRFDHYAVVLDGILDNIESGHDVKDLPVGSYIFQPGGNKHTANCKAGGAECMVYTHFLGAYDIKAM